MKNPFANDSLVFKVRLAFVVSTVLIASLFVFLFVAEDRYEQIEFHERVEWALRMSHHLEATPDVLKERLAELDFILLPIEQTQTIISRATLDERVDVKRFVLSFYRFEGKRLILATSKHGSILFEDDRQQHRFLIIAVAVMTAVLLVIVLLYRSIARGIAPITRLKRTVDEFAKDGTFAPYDGALCNELQSLHDAFEEMAMHMRSIAEARSLLLRNIAHELKTPLTKGRFLSENIEDQALKERFDTLFIRFDSLINELLQVEKITAQGLVLSEKIYSLEDMLDEARDKAFLDEKNVTLPHIQMRIRGDFSLLTLAFKNLLDNGVKFSLDSHVDVTLKNDVLCFQNSGEQMVVSFEQASKAFSKGQEATAGFGLGLFIVQRILHAHGLELTYIYQEKIHHFSIDLRTLKA